MAKKGRSTVYNSITSEEKMAQVNQDNIDLENDYLDYLRSVDRAKTTIYQYQMNLHVFWCWNLEFNKNKFFVDLTKREISKFQNHALNVWGWSPKRIRTVKATLSSLSNYIENILDDEYEGYKPIVRKIESPANEAVRDDSILSEEEAQNLLDKLIEMKQYEKACFIALSMYSGKRKSELVIFKVSYFDKENLICAGALYKTPEKIKTKGRGSKGKMIYAYTLAKPFQPYFDMWIEERNRLGIKSEWLFPQYEDGQWIDKHIPTTTVDSWNRYFSKLVGKPIWQHSWRHWYTSYMLDQNLPESVVQTLQQWGSVDMVRLYDSRPEENQLDKFFGEDGIKQIERKRLEDL
jgi:integrase